MWLNLISFQYLVALSDLTRSNYGAMGGPKEGILKQNLKDVI